MQPDLTGTVTHSHDPKPPELPPLPEAIGIVTSLGDALWYFDCIGTLSQVEAEQKQTRESDPTHATRIITIQPPPSAREVSDAEVVKIMREVGIGYLNWTDSEMLSKFDVTAKCVRAALKGVAHAK